MDDFSKIKMIIEENNGYITSEIARKNNIATIYLTRLVNKGIINRVARGVYIDANCLEDEFYIISIKYSRAVFSRRTALYLNNLSNRSITKYEVNVPLDYNNPIPGSTVHRVNDNLYNIGLIDIKTPYGNIVKSYDIERCICDIFLFNEYDIEQKKYAIDIYKQQGIDYQKLYKYAKALGVYDVVVNIFEVV